MHGLALRSLQRVLGLLHDMGFRENECREQNRGNEKQGLGGSELGKNGLEDVVKEEMSSR